MLEVLSYAFFQDALLATILASVACGVIGTYVVVKRTASISGGLSHAALGGVGLGYYAGFAPLAGATIFSVLAGLLMGAVYRRKHDTLDNLIAMIWSVGMAIGIVFIAMTPGYAPDLTSYLFGNLLFVTPDYLLLVAAFDLVIVATVIVLFREFQAVSFDEEFAEILGVPVERVFLFLIVLMALTVVLLIRVVGVILTIALLTTPAVIARQWSTNLRRMMIIAVCVSALCSVAGLFLSVWLSTSFELRIPTGPLIVLVVCVCYLVSSLIRGRDALRSA